MALSRTEGSNRQLPHPDTHGLLGMVPHSTMDEGRYRYEILEFALKAFTIEQWPRWAVAFSNSSRHSKGTGHPIGK